QCRIGQQTPIRRKAQAPVCKSAKIYQNYYSKLWPNAHVCVKRTPDSKRFSIPHMIKRLPRKKLFRQPRLLSRQKSSATNSHRKPKSLCFRACFAGARMSMRCVGKVRMDDQAIRPLAFENGSRMLTVNSTFPPKDSPPIASLRAWVERNLAQPSSSRR